LSAGPVDQTTTPTENHATSALAAERHDVGSSAHADQSSESPAPPRQQKPPENIFTLKKTGPFTHENAVKVDAPFAKSSLDNTNIVKFGNQGNNAGNPVSGTNGPLGIPGTTVGASSSPASTLITPGITDRRKIVARRIKRRQG
jgi:hypothetical protein